MKKKVLTLLAITFITTFASLTLILKSNGQVNAFRKEAAPKSGSYKLTLDSSNPFVIGEDSHITLSQYTNNGNEIVFEGMNLESKANCLCSISYDTTGNYKNFIKNLTPIDCYVGVKAIFDDADIEDNLFIEWVNESTGEVFSDVIVHNTYTEIGHASTFNPSYCKFSCGADWNQDGGTAIKQLEIYYSCIPADHVPFPSYLEAEIIDGEAYISKYKSLNAGTRTVEIPSTYNGYPVVGIKSAGVFMGDMSVGYVILPNTIRSIPAYCFYGCERLYGIQLSSSMTSIPERSFYQCYALTSIVIPDGITSIEAYAFYYSGLEGQIVMPNSMKSVGTNAFMGTSVESYVISSRCNFEVSNNSILPGVILRTYVSSAASDLLYGFYGVTDTTLRKYYLTSTQYLTYIKYDVGEGESIAIVKAACGGEVSIPSDIDGLPVTYIGPESFKGSGVTTLNLTLDVLYLGYRAFYNSYIKTLRTYEGLKKIGRECFAQSNYTNRDDYLSLYLSSSTVEFVGTSAFQNLDTRFYFDGEDISSSWDYGWDASIKKKTINTNSSAFCPSFMFVRFSPETDISLELFHNNNMGYVFTNRYKDYLKDLSTGVAVESGPGSVLIRISNNDTVFDASNISVNDSDAQIVARGNNIFEINNVHHAKMIEISNPTLHKRSVTLVKGYGSMNPYFYNDPVTKESVNEGLFHYASDENGNVVYDNTGMVSFRINPGQYKKPSFSGDDIIGTYDHFEINKDVVTIYGIESNLTINLRVVDDFHVVTFSYDSGIEKILIYPREAYLSEYAEELIDGRYTYTRNPNNGEYASEYSFSKPQVNFEFVLKEGYQLADISITPSTGYNKFKIAGGNIRRITVITTDLTVTLSTSVIES